MTIFYLILHLTQTNMNVFEKLFSNFFKSWYPLALINSCTINHSASKHLRGQVLCATHWGVWRLRQFQEALWPVKQTGSTQANRCGSFMAWQVPRRKSRWRCHVSYWVVESRGRANSDGVAREDLEGRNADVDVEELGEQHSGQKNQQSQSPQVCLAAGRERRQEWLEFGKTMT